MASLIIEEIFEVEASSSNEDFDDPNKSVEVTALEDRFQLPKDTDTRICKKEQDSKMSETKFGEKFYFCEDKSDLVAKPYQCHICLKSFSLKGILEKHRSIHSQSRPSESVEVTALEDRFQLPKDTDSRVCNIQQNFEMSETKFGEKFYFCEDKSDIREKSFQCDICLKSFYWRGDLKTHKRGVHSQSKPFKCDICSKSFSLKGSLKAHRSRHSQSTPSESAEVIALEDRFQLPKITDTRICNIQQNSEMSETKFGEKFYFCEDESDIRVKSFQCDICLKSFYWKANLKTHKISVHSLSKPFKCDICFKSFSLKGNLKAHRSLHCLHSQSRPSASVEVTALEDRFQLPKITDTRICNIQQDFEMSETKFGEKFYFCEDKSDLVEKPYQCDICFKSFSQKSNLKTHQRVHSQSKPYKCDICLKSFSLKANLKIHESVHSQSKPYRCDICFKSFSLEGNLKKHISVHSESRPYECDVCFKSLRSKGSLKQHKKVHTQSRPYKCELCEKTFLFERRLIRHIRVHSGEKPFKCEICATSFRHSSTLCRHRRIHTGEKPYQCEICQKKFIGKCELTIHSRVHSGEKPFQCDICMLEFSHKSSLNSHKSVHTNKKPH